MRTRQDFGHWAGHELPKLGGLSLLTSLRRLDIDGLTELRPGDAALLAGLTRLEALMLRNTAHLRLAHLSSLSRLTRLARLDFSLHGEFAETAAIMVMGCGCSAQNPLGALQLMTGLTDLDLANRQDFCYVRDMPRLAQLTTLTKLNLRNVLEGDDVPVLDALRPLSTLQRLKVGVGACLLGEGGSVLLREWTQTPSRPVAVFAQPG